MGTGGKVNTKGGTTPEQKLKAIESLVRNGPRGSEWQEAGLLHAIEKILDGHDCSSDALKQLMREAREN